MSLCPRSFITKGCCFLSKVFFLHLMKWFCGFWLSVCVYGGLLLLTYICWTIPASLRWSLLDHGERSFWCDLWFSLQVVCSEFLHLCSWRKLLCNSVSLWDFIWFGYSVLKLSDSGLLFGWETFDDSFYFIRGYGSV